MSPDEIERALQPLVGLSWRAIGRAADVVWLQFGQLRKVPAFKGATKSVGEWALHLQCDWRLLKDDRGLLSAEDIRIDENGAPVIDEPGRLGQSVFDDAAWWLNNSLARNAPWTSAISVGKPPSFSILLSDGRKFDIAARGEGEQWRIFQPATDGNAHFVVSL